MKIASRALAGLCLAAVVAAGPVAALATQEQPQTAPQAQGHAPSGQQERRFWWKDAAVQKELGLSKGQAGKIDAIWAASAPSIRAAHKEMDGLEAEFNRLIKENTADERVIALQIDRVEALRSQINKARWLMLYRMHRVLTPEQYQALTRLRERERKERGRR